MDGCLTSSKRAIRVSGQSVTTWASVPQQIDEVVRTSAEPFDQQTIQNARDFVAACKGRCTGPDVVAKGYWSTISLSWTNIEVEIFADHLELYNFLDKKTDIRHFVRKPEEQIPDDLLGKLVGLMNPQSK
jgi:hypothetical protein